VGVTGPLHTPPTQLFVAHCASVVQAASVPPQMPSWHWTPAGHWEVMPQGEPRKKGPILKGVTVTWGAGWVMLAVLEGELGTGRGLLWRRHN
jgi:hypothetical protein